MSQIISVRLAFLIVFFSVILALMLGSLFGALDPSILSGADPGLSAYIAMFMGQGFLIIPTLFFLTRKNLSLAENLRFHPVSSKVIAATILLSLGAMIISDEINILVDKFIPMPESFLQVEAMLTPDNTLSLFLLIITIVIIAPIGEELLFRGFLQKLLEDIWGDITKAILVSSLFFAAIHFNPYWMIQIYFLGILLGYLAWRTQSVIPCIIFHVIINGASLLFTSLGDSLESIMIWNGHINPLILFIGTGLFIYGFNQLKVVTEP